MQGFLRMSLALVLVSGCGPAVQDSPSDGSTSGGPSTSSVGGEVPMPSTTGVPPNPTGTPPEPTGMPPGTSDGTTTSGRGSSSENESGGFITDPDGGGCAAGLPGGVLAHCSWCDPKVQDCAKEDTCKAWANDGSDVWNSTRCSPTDPEPGQRGDACVAEGSATSGVDSCDRGLMCWNVDADTLEGTCFEYCTLAAGKLQCSDPNERCSEFNEGALPLCLPACDPLAPACGDGFGCYPGSQDDFVCIREGERVHLDVFHPECPPGTFWATPDAVEGCVDDQPCCTSFCDIAVPDSCGPETECLPYFEGGLPDEALGYCSIAS